MLLPISAAFFLYSDTITTSLYGNGFAPAADAVRILSATVVLVGLSTLALYVLVSRDRQRATPWIAGLSFLLNLGLVIALVPSISFRGAAVAILADQILYTVGMVLLVRRDTGPIAWGRVAMAIGKCSDDTDIDERRVVIRFAAQEMYPRPVDDDDLAALTKYLAGDDVTIHVSLGIANGQFTVYGCDLSDGYVRINADYTT
jgi:hypothetical protein